MSEFENVTEMGVDCPQFIDIPQNAKKSMINIESSPTNNNRDGHENSGDFDDSILQTVLNRNEQVIVGKKTNQPIDFSDDTIRK